MKTCKMSFKGVKRNVIVTDTSIYTKENCSYSDKDIICDLEEMIFDDEEMTMAEAFEKGILTETEKKPVISNVPEAAKNGKIWTSGSKVRYYLTDSYYQKASAFFSEKEDSAKYSWKVNGGFVYASKCYNGTIEEMIIADFGEVL